MLTRHGDRRTHNEYAAQAALHGMKLNYRSNVEHEKKIEETQEPEIDPAVHERMMRAAQDRVKQRYGG